MPAVKSLPSFHKSRGATFHSSASETETRNLKICHSPVSRFRRLILKSFAKRIEFSRFKRERMGNDKLFETIFPSGNLSLELRRPLRHGKHHKGRGKHVISDICVNFHLPFVRRGTKIPLNNAVIHSLRERKCVPN